MKKGYFLIARVDKLEAWNYCYLQHSKAYIKKREGEREWKLVKDLGVFISTESILYSLPQSSLTAAHIFFFASQVLLQALFLFINDTI